MAENKKKNDPRSVMSALINAGKSEEQKVQNIKSVASAPDLAAPEEISIIATAEEQYPSPAITAPQSEEELEKSNTPKETETNRLPLLFNKREVKDTEAVKIPREFHKELKILSSMSGTSMMQMIGNLIEDFLVTNKEEISLYKKKYMNETLNIK